MIGERALITPLQLHGKHVFIAGSKGGWGDGKLLNQTFALGHELSIEPMFKRHAKFTNLTLI